MKQLFSELNKDGLSDSDSSEGSFCSDFDDSSPFANDFDKLTYEMEGSSRVI